MKDEYRFPEDEDISDQLKLFKDWLIENAIKPDNEGISRSIYKFKQVCPQHYFLLFGDDTCSLDLKRIQNTQRDKVIWQMIMSVKNSITYDNSKL